MRAIGAQSAEARALPIGETPCKLERRGDVLRTSTVVLVPRRGRACRNCLLALFKPQSMREKKRAQLPAVTSAGSGSCIG
jgi:hypothetical protein